MTAACTADVACIGFMYHHELGFGKLIYSLSGDSSPENESWPLFMDAGILASQSINVDDVGQSMAFCVEANCACDGADTFKDHTLDEEATPDHTFPCDSGYSQRF